MESLSIAFFIISGFLFINSIRSIQKYKINGDWSYLVPLVIWSFFFFILSKTIINSVIIFIPVVFINYAYYIKLAFADIPHFFTIIVSILLSVITSQLLVLIYNKAISTTKNSQKDLIISLSKRTIKITEKILSLTIFNKGDDLIQELYKLSGEVVIISVSSGRYYIGIIRVTPTDSDDEFRIISIAPLWSGARDPDRPSIVIYDTNYIMNHDYPNPDITLIEVIIPFSEIKSIALFDRLLNDYFISIGKSKFLPGKFSRRKKKESAG
jgi:hypothetical protein